jgi:hypothetical protein
VVATYATAVRRAVALLPGVEVTAAVSAGVLRVTFRPDAGFHLYSKDLPVGGVDGVGYATQVSLTTGLRATGPTKADREVESLRVEGVAGELPVYPAGPVTLTLPVDGTKGTVTVGYAACSDRVCLPPVQRLTVAVG